MQAISLILLQLGRQEQKMKFVTGNSHKAIIETCDLTIYMYLCLSVCLSIYWLTVYLFITKKTLTQQEQEA